MQTVIPPLTGRASKFTREEAQALREEMLALLRESHPAASAKREDFAEAKPRGKAIEVWNGSVCVRIYKTKWRDKKRRKLYRSYTLVWRDAGRRFRQKKSKLEDAKKRAEQIAGAISSGETNRLQFSQANIASFMRCLELLSSADVPIGIELAISKYVEWSKKVGSPGAVDHALQFFQEHQPKDVVPKNVPELVEQLLADKERLGRGKKWLVELRRQLEWWASKFKGAIYGVRAHEISKALDEKKVGLRTRKNLLASFGELVRFAQAKDQLSRTWNELKLVDKPELPPVEVEIYTPEQIVSLLDVTRPNMIPFTVLQAFAGIRHEEMNGTKALLDWRDINLQTGRIKIKKTVNKTKKQRFIQMQPNLIAWLRPYSRPNGLICELGHTANALVRAKHRAGIPAGRGKLTNALRASFISYRLAQTNDIGLVAREAGNSPNIIKEHYLELVGPEEANRWFNIWPKKHANVIDWKKDDLPFNATPGSQSSHLANSGQQSPIGPQRKTAP